MVTAGSRTNGTGDILPATGKWSIGSRYYTDLHIDGQIQHVSVFNKYLYPDNVAQLHAEPYCFIEGWNYGRVYSVPSGIVYYGSLIGDSALIGNGVLIGGGIAA